MARTKTEEPNPTAQATAVRGFNFRPAGADVEIRVEAGEEIPSTVPPEVVQALVAEGSASRGVA